jgi:hypothetical protein
MLIGCATNLECDIPNPLSEEIEKATQIKKEYRDLGYTIETLPSIKEDNLDLSQLDNTVMKKSDIDNLIFEYPDLFFLIETTNTEISDEHIWYLTDSIILKNNDKKLGKSFVNSGAVLSYDSQIVKNDKDAYVWNGEYLMIFDVDVLLGLRYHYSPEDFDYNMRVIWKEEKIVGLLFEMI